MRLLANALAGNHSSAAVNHHTPAWHPRQFDQDTVGGTASPPSYNDTSYAPLNRRASQQLNRIGSGQARPPSAGPGPILGASQALFDVDGTDGVHYTYYINSTSYEQLWALLCYCCNNVVTQLHSCIEINKIIVFFCHTLLRHTQ